MDSDHTDVLIPKEEKKYKMGQELNMKMVTVRKTLKQTAESFISWPVCHEKRQACQILQTVKAPKTLASSHFQLPTPHAQTTQENCLSPFILVPFGYTSVYAKPLPKPLPSSCHCVPAAAFWGLQGTAAVFRGGTGWQG